MFYIIIEGEVRLHVPTILEAELTPEELFCFLIENESEIDWEIMKVNLHYLTEPSKFMEFKSIQEIDRLVDKLRDNIKY